MNSKSKVENESEKLAWQKHNQGNFQYFRSLDIRTKLIAVEGMADTVRKLQKLHDQRKKHS